MFDYFTLTSSLKLLNGVLAIYILHLDVIKNTVPAFNLYSQWEYLCPNFLEYILFGNHNKD